MQLPKSVIRVAESFESLPGIGPKTAQRLAYYLLRVPDNMLEKFANSVARLKLDTKRCSVCLGIGDADPCDICSGNNRNKNQICVVEQPMDLLAIEKVGFYKGVYHVLHGVIAPLEHIGPEEIFVNELFNRVNENTEEVILALNANMEGEATALYIKQQLEKKNGNQNLKITRLAQGMPLGGDVGYTDAVTLGRALEGRRGY